VVTRFLIACIASMAIGAHAVPIVFTNSQFDTTAVALAQGAADTDFDTTPSAPLPVQSSATVVGSSDFASAAALGTTGLLTSFAEGEGAVGVTDAVGQSHFLGSLLGNGLLVLHLNFDTFTSLVGGGTGSGTLAVLFTNRIGATTTTLFNNVFTSAGNIALSFVLPAGGTSSLDLTLFSEASTTGARQSGQNFSQLQFSGDLPLPATPLLLLAGVGAMMFARRRHGAVGR
jgi:hypothetical protein